MRKIASLILGAFLCIAMNAQGPVQTIRGTVFEKETRFPLVGATVVLLNTEPQVASITGPDGKFKIQKVPVGRYNIQISFLGYEPYIVPEIMVGSAKEVVINAGLSESAVEMEAVEVKAAIKKDKPLNSMATLSARMMNMDEARRYAGGFDDPARVAASFAGVASGLMDNNEIVIRGNSSKGLSWRLEGVEIPNPNHFAEMAAVGAGGITLFSSQMLTNSDFYTGAFPAEYGNVTSGVFDMKLRNGNNEQYEHAFQIGAMGVDFASEGPFKKGGNASYLFNYRYSTFGIIKVVLPEEANIPVYQDLSFKFNFPTQKAGTFSLWGIGGLDEITGEPRDSSHWENWYDREIMLGTIDIGAAGLNHKLRLGRKTYIENIFSASVNNTFLSIDMLDFDITTEHPMKRVNDKNWNYTYSGKINTKFSASHTNRTGIIVNQKHYNTLIESSAEEGARLDEFVNSNGSTEMYQLYSQSRFKVTSAFTINTGFNLGYVALNKEFTAEPRLGMSYKIPSGLTLSLGYGKHSRLEPLGIYLLELENAKGKYHPNIDLRTTKSHHLVLGTDYSFSPYLRIKVEPYVQCLYDVPVIPDSTYSTINMAQAWNLFSELSNDGTGINYGLDVTFERFLHKGYYYLITASVFDSKYTDGHGDTRNTRYNRNYVVNLLYGKEWKVKKNHIFSINSKLKLMNGNRAIPINHELSVQTEDIVLDYSRAYEEHDPFIYQLDLTLTYKVNRTKYSSSWALQVLNVLGRKEYYGSSYNYKSQSVERDEERIIVPSISYKIDF